MTLKKEIMTLDECRNKWYKQRNVRIVLGNIVAPKIAQLKGSFETCNYSVGESDGKEPKHYREMMSHHFVLDAKCNEFSFTVKRGCYTYLVTTLNPLCLFTYFKVL